MDQKQVKPFGLSDKIGYLFGDFGNDFTFIFASTFLMVFYMKVLGIPGAAVGTLFLVARVVDAFTDVTMGRIVDICKPGKDGRFKQWIRRMAGPVAIASFLMYQSSLAGASMTVKVVYMYATYLLWGSICYTGINIPYGSMASAITADPKERTSLSSFRTIGATLANTVISVVLPLIVYYEDAQGNTIFSGERMMIAALLCSIGAVICYLLCYHMTTERVKLEKTTEKFSFGDLIRTTVSNRALVGIVAAALLLLLAQLTLAGMGNYIYPNYFGNREAMSTANLGTTIITLALSMVIVKISGKYGRKELAGAGAVVGAVALIAAFILHTDNVWVFVGLYLVSSLGTAIFNLVCWAMITDVIDDAEVRTGKRSDGTIYAVYSFARKLGQAASSGLTGGLLTLVGYSAVTAFDPKVIDGIYNITCLVPAAGFLLLALALKFLYPLDRKKVEENIRILKEKRGE